MSLITMTKAEREAFLADVHVGIIGIADESGRAPLTVPVWYMYQPGGEVRVITGRNSRKAQLLNRAGRFSLCAQTETVPYKYVSVEGPIVGIDVIELERDIRAMARRYYGVEEGDKYAARVAETSLREEMVVRMRPERWLTVDYAKEEGEV
jgi:nitroimidazol reductase NimA-like FMN-containing flavoprotein (pyridoxamine 5'-phosphate oxidase superfamily)